MRQEVAYSISSSKGGFMTKSSVARAVNRAHALLVANCFYPLLMGSLLAGSFLMLRYGFTGSMRYRFLVWNLFLAWIPYGCAVALKYGWSDRDGRERTRRKAAGLHGGDGAGGGDVVAHVSERAVHPHGRRAPHEGTPLPLVVRRGARFVVRIDGLFSRCRLPADHA